MNRSFTRNSFREKEIIMKFILLVSLLLNFQLFAQETSATSSFNAEANFTCDGITKDFIKEKKIKCNQIKDKKEKKECRRDLKVVKKCLSKTKNRGLKVCKALVKVMTKRMKEGVKTRYSSKSDKKLRKELTKKIKQQKRDWINKCKTAAKKARV